MTFRWNPHAAFSLMELVVVLALLGLLAHLAVRELSKADGARRHAAANRQLEELRTAIAGDPDARDATGARLREGFLADLGRPPAAVPLDPSAPDSPLSLRELWECPSDAGPFALRPATEDNLVPACRGLGLADPDAYVPCGWRGPYLRLPLGATRLLDPWGNPLETPDTAGCARLLDAATNAVAPGSAIAWACHFGADGRRDDPAERGSAPEDADALLRVDADSVTPVATRLLVTVRQLDTLGAAAADAPGRQASAVLYSPCGSAITAAVHVATLDASATAQILFDAGLTPGTRVLRVRLDNGQTGAPHSLRLQPGDNAFVETFRSPSGGFAPPSPLP